MRACQGQSRRIFVALRNGEGYIEWEGVLLVVVVWEKDFGGVKVVAVGEFC